MRKTTRLEPLLCIFYFLSFFILKLINTISLFRGRGDPGKVAATKTGRNDIRYVVWAISKGSTRQHQTTTNINIRNDEPKMIRDIDASRTPDTFFSILFFFIYTDSCIFTSHMYERRKPTPNKPIYHINVSRSSREQRGLETYASWAHGQWLGLEVSCVSSSGRL